MTLFTLPNPASITQPPHHTHRFAAGREQRVVHADNFVLSKKPSDKGAAKDIDINSHRVRLLAAREKVCARVYVCVCAHVHVRVLVLVLLLSHPIYTHARARAHTHTHTHAHTHTQGTVAPKNVLRRRAYWAYMEDEETHASFTTERCVCARARTWPHVCWCLQTYLFVTNVCFHANRSMDKHIARMQKARGV